MSACVHASTKKVTVSGCKQLIGSRTAVTMKAGKVRRIGIATVLTIFIHDGTAYASKLTTAAFGFSFRHINHQDLLTSSRSVAAASTTSINMESGSSSISATSAISSTTTRNNIELDGISWEVYVSQANKNNKDKGVLSASSVMESFTAFSPSPGVIKVNSAIFSKQPKPGVTNKIKGHLVRCIQKKDDLTLSAIEINNVDTIEKVYRIVTEHMRLTTVNSKACECMKFYFQGNESLEEEGNPSKAIALYNRALSLADKHTRQTSQLPKGSILMKRARAYLQRAANHRKILRLLVKDLTDTVPSASTMKILYQTAASHPELSASIFQRLAGDSKVNQGKFRQIRYRHDMYEFALLHATQDSLQATQLLPKTASTWYLAGECLAELRKLNESNQYYVRALALDPSMKDVLTTLMEKNKSSQEYIDAARAGGFSGDTLRLAMDVATS